MTRLAIRDGESAPPFWGLARWLGLGVLLLSVYVCVANSAKADIFNVTATVGITQGSNETKAATSDTLTGTLDINTVSGVLDSLTLQILTGPEPHVTPITGFFGCPNACTFYFNTYAPPFDLYGLLDLTSGGSLVGYAGGTLAPDSYIYLDSSALMLTGSVTPAVTAAAATPEPAFYGVLAIGMAILFFAVRFRQSA